MLGICVEASHRRGMGHLYRMLNFCDFLNDKSIPFRFFINSHQPSLELLTQRRLPFESVSVDSEKGDWQARLIRKYDIKLWIDDRLDTNVEHTLQIKNCGIPLVTFDNRGSGAALADLNVMALAFDEKELLQGKKVVRGPRYLILNREIEHYRRLRKKKDSVVVSLGGSDTYGVTLKVIQILKSRGLCATIVVGPVFQHEAEVLSLVDDSFVLKKYVPSLIREFSHHDLAITGGGITAFEANASGLPSIVIANETFEIPVGRGISSLGGSIFAGHHTVIDEELFSLDLPIQEMSEAAMKHIDLQGASRVYDEIKALL